MAGTVRVLREADVRSALPMDVCIDAVERAFVAYTKGDAETPGVIHLDVPEAGGEIHIKAGHLHGAPAYALKTSSGFAGDPPALDGLVVVFDAEDGAPLAFLLDHGFVTDQRTGAAGGVAAKWLAPERVGAVAVIGSGIQARKQVEALRTVRPDLGEIRVWGRNPEHAALAAADVGGTPVATVEGAVSGADVILTCTAAREPLVRVAWVAPGAHITAAGSDGPGKQELDPELLRRADLLVVDAVDQAERLGELQHAPQERERAAELGAICAGSTPGRTSPEQLTICDLTGVGVQDVAAANAILANAGGAGELLEL
jgi:ornithine cyclodeaminase/alanine dehydrogenase-like protein (mu-crystallin family)